MCYRAATVRERLTNGTSFLTHYTSAASHLLWTGRESPRMRKANEEGVPSTAESTETATPAPFFKNYLFIINILRSTNGNAVAVASGVCDINGETSLALLPAP